MKACCLVAQLCLTLQPQGLQHTRLLCPLPSSGVCWSSCPLGQWCHPTVVLCHPLLLLPSIFPSIRVFSSELGEGCERGIHITKNKNADCLKLVIIISENTMISTSSPSFQHSQEICSLTYKAVPPPQPLLWGFRNGDKYWTCFILFMLPATLCGNLSSAFCRWENWGSKNLSDGTKGHSRSVDRFWPGHLGVWTL